jgi:NAD(P)-dependent dehydrogenase (short-subunit alcohol dehydrogenase family)
MSPQRQTWCESVPDPFDILVDSAGVARHAAFLDVSEADYRWTLDLNLGTMLFASQVMAKRSIATGMPGSIIHISSQMGHVGGPDRSVYSARKFAIDGLTKSMRSHSRAQGSGQQHPPGLHRNRALGQESERTRLPRLGLGEDQAGPDGPGRGYCGTILLASDASALTTASALTVDGGWTAE